MDHLQPQLGTAQHPVGEPRSAQQTVPRSTFWAWLAWVSGALLCFAVVASLVSYFIGFGNGRADLANIIALKSIPHTDDPALNDNYTAIVWTQPEKDRLGVFARIAIGTTFGGLEYNQEVGRLGTATNRSDAIDRFGEISWNNTTVFIGAEPGKGFQVSRKELQKDR